MDFFRSEYCEEAQQGLNETFNGFDSALKRMAENGWLWRVENDGDFLGWLVFKTLTLDNGEKEIFVEAYQGKDLKLVADALKTAGKEKGFSRIVYFTHRKGMTRILENAGFKITGYNLQADL